MSREPFTVARGTTMGAPGLPQLLILVLGLGVLAVESAGVALLVDLLRGPRPVQAPGERLLIGGVVSLIIVVGVAAAATFLALSAPK